MERQSKRNERKGARQRKSNIRRNERSKLRLRIPIDSATAEMIPFDTYCGEEGG